MLALNCVAYHELLYLSRYAHIHIELLHVQPSGRGFLISDFYKTILHKLFNLEERGQSARTLCIYLSIY